MALTQWNPNFRNAVVQQWNLSLQRQIFPGWVATGAYVGSKGNHLFLSSELNPAIFGAPGANLNARRPLYPVFANVTDQSSRGNSVYHAMQLTLNKRFSHGLTLQTNYTWSKLIDDASGDGDAPSNPFDFHNERGPSDFDITTASSARSSMSCPHCRARPFFSVEIAGGWQVNGIASIQSGSW